MDPDEIIAKQGWSDTSVIDLMWKYLVTTGQVDAFTEFLAREADEENAEADEADEVSP